MLGQLIRIGDGGGQAAGLLVGTEMNRGVTAIFMPILTCWREP